MLDCLKTAKDEERLDGPGLLEYWHKRMELDNSRAFRNGFFSEVVNQANKFTSSVNEEESFVSDYSIIMILYHKLMILSRPLITERLKARTASQENPMGT